MSIMKQYILGLTIVLFLFCFGTYAAEYSDGKLGKALILDGSSHTVKIPHYAGLKPRKVKKLSRAQKHLNLFPAFSAESIILAAFAVISARSSSRSSWPIVGTEDAVARRRGTTSFTSRSPI